MESHVCGQDALMRSGCVGQVFVEHAASDGTFMYSDKVRTFCGMDERGCVALPMNPVQAVPPETAFLSPSDTWVVLIEEV